MNKVILMGNLTRDPENQTYSQGKICFRQIPRFSIVQKTCRLARQGIVLYRFFNCPAPLGSQAEFVRETISKRGIRMLLKLDAFRTTTTNNKTGEKVCTVYRSIAEEVEFAEEKEYWRCQCSHEKQRWFWRRSSGTSYGGG